MKPFLISLFTLFQFFSFAQTALSETKELQLKIYSNYVYSNITVSITLKEPKSITFSFETKPIGKYASLHSTDVAFLNTTSNVATFDKPTFDTIYVLSNGGWLSKCTFELSADQISKLKSKQITSVGLQFPFRQLFLCYLTKKGQTNLEDFLKNL